MNVYGPRQDYRGAYIAVIMKMLDAIDRGEPLVLFGDGTQAYDFVYVGDCAAANVCAMKAETVDRSYNVGTGIRTSLQEIAALILELTGSDVGIRYEAGGTTFVKNRIGSTSRAEAEIGFIARVRLQEGLARLIEWRAGHKEEVEARRLAGDERLRAVPPARDRRRLRRLHREGLPRGARGGSDAISLRAVRHRTRRSHTFSGDTTSISRCTALRVSRDSKPRRVSGRRTSSSSIRLFTTCSSIR